MWNFKELSNVSNLCLTNLTCQSKASFVTHIFVALLFYNIIRDVNTIIYAMLMLIVITIIFYLLFSFNLSICIRLLEILVNKYQLGHSNDISTSIRNKKRNHKLSSSQYHEQFSVEFYHRFFKINSVNALQKKQCRENIVYSIINLFYSSFKYTHIIGKRYTVSPTIKMSYFIDFYHNNWKKKLLTYYLKFERGIVNSRFLNNSSSIVVYADVSQNLRPIIYQKKLESLEVSYLRYTISILKTAEYHVLNASRMTLKLNNFSPNKTESCSYYNILSKVISAHYYPTDNEKNQKLADNTKNILNIHFVSDTDVIRYNDIIHYTDLIFTLNIIITTNNLISSFSQMDQFLFLKSTVMIYNRFALTKGYDKVLPILAEYCSTKSELLSLSMAIRLLASYTFNDKNTCQSFIAEETIAFFKFCIKKPMEMTLDSFFAIINVCLIIMFLSFNLPGESSLYQISIFKFFFKDMMPEFFFFLTPLTSCEQSFTNFFNILFKILESNTGNDKETIWSLFFEFFAEHKRLFLESYKKILIQIIDIFQQNNELTEYVVEKLNQIIQWLTPSSPSSFKTILSKFQNTDLPLSFRKTVSSYIESDWLNNSCSECMEFLYFNTKLSNKFLKDEFCYNCTPEDQSVYSTTDTDFINRSSYLNYDKLSSESLVDSHTKTFSCDQHPFTNIYDSQIFYKHFNIYSFSELYARWMDSIEIYNNEFQFEKLVYLFYDIKSKYEIEKSRNNKRLIINVLAILHRIFMDNNQESHKDIFNFLCEQNVFHIMVYTSEIMRALSTSNQSFAFTLLCRFVSIYTRNDEVIFVNNCENSNFSIWESCMNVIVNYFQYLIDTLEISSVFNYLRILSVTASELNKLLISIVMVKANIQTTFHPLDIICSEAYDKFYVYKKIEYSEYKNLITNLTENETIQYLINEEEGILLRYPVTMDEQLFITLLHCINIKKDWKHIYYVIEQFKKKWHKYLLLDLPAYNLMIKLLGYAKQSENCKWVFNFMNSKYNFKLTEITYGCYLDALINNNLLNEAIIIFDYIRNKRIVQPNTIIYSTLVKGYAQRKQVNEALKLYNEMKSLNISINTVTYNTIIDVCARSGSMDYGVIILNDMLSNGVRPDLITFSTLAKGYCVKGDILNAMKILKLLKLKGIQPDGIFYNSLLDGCVRAMRPDLCQMIWNEMRMSGIVPSNFTLTILVKMLGKVGKLTEAFDIVQKLPAIYNFKINTHVYTCLMSACIANKKYEQALEVYHTMQFENISLDYKTYETAMIGAIKAKQYNEAINIVKKVFLIDEIESGKIKEHNRNRIIGFNLNPRKIQNLWEALFKEGEKELAASTMKKLKYFYGQKIDPYLFISKRY